MTGNAFPDFPSPIVTIVMPCFNAAKTITESILSIQNQTVTNWELVVVDDGSSDNSRKIVKQLSTDDKRIKLVCQPNSGPSVARNYGVGLAGKSVPYIAFLDSDDQWQSDHLAIHLANLESDEAIGISFAACEIMDEADNLTGEITRIPDGPLTKTQILHSNPTTTCSTLVFRKSVYDRAGGLRDDMKYAEDQEWLFRVLVSGYQIIPVGIRTVRYRTSSGGLSADIEKMAEGWEQFIKYARKLDPLTVEKGYAPAKSSMALYHARRSVRTFQSFGTSWKYLRRAAFEGRLTGLRQYFQAIAIAIAALSPRIFNFVFSSLKGQVHARH